MYILHGVLVTHCYSLLYTHKTHTTPPSKKAFLALIAKYRPDVLSLPDALARCNGDAHQQVALAFKVARCVGCVFWLLCVCVCLYI